MLYAPAAMLRGHLDENMVRLPKPIVSGGGIGPSRAPAIDGCDFRPLYREAAENKIPLASILP